MNHTQLANKAKYKYFKTLGRGPTNKINVVHSSSFFNSGPAQPGTTLLLFSIELDSKSYI